jgi:hypothetical protein
MVSLGTVKLLGICHFRRCGTPCRPGSTIVPLDSCKPQEGTSNDPFTHTSFLLAPVSLHLGKHSLPHSTPTAAPLSLPCDGDGDGDDDFPSSHSVSEKVVPYSTSAGLGTIWTLFSYSSELICVARVSMRFVPIPCS